MKREFLVTKFKCAVCGSLLALKHEAPKSRSDYADGEPTGAAMVEQFVAIEPCLQCSLPVKEVKQALKTLLTLGGGA